MIDKNKEVAGHLSAIFTILIWGTTFISTKVLLKSFEPIEILFFRFSIGFVALMIACPRRLKLTDKNQEWIFIGAGISGVTLYFLLENIALTYSSASNVGVIMSIAPFFTAIFANWFLKGERGKGNFLIGFIVAITGIFLISFNGSIILKLNPIGDLLAILAAVLWAVYSILTRKISAYGYNTIQTTRHIFFYGLLFMLPIILLFDFSLGIERFREPVNLFNILFLGFGASALCFVTWNTAVKYLGAVKTSVYIYIVPVVVVVTSVLILKEKITWMSALGIILTLSGLIISESKIFFLKRGIENEYTR